MDIDGKFTQAVVELLERGVKPWTQPWSAGPGAGLPLRHNGQRYRGINVLIRRPGLRLAVRLGFGG